MMIGTFILLMAICGVVQMLMSNKVKNVVVRYLPTAIATAGLLFCLITHWSFWATSSSVIAENQYFAKFLVVPLGGGLLGCVLGLIFSKVNKQHKQS